MTASPAAALVIPAHLRDRQHSASDPARSIWVSANAGSGKTHVLTQRVIRLLLAGVAPSKILCLTFTKAAAAEMSGRVFKALAEWPVLDDGALRERILATGAPAPNAAELLLARRLFTRTVETPGGLKIQTIHAFCERLLHLFPFEANVPARFEVADDIRTMEMMSLAKRTAVDAAQRRGGKAGAALAQIAEAAGATGLDALLADAMPLRKAARRGGDRQSTLAARLGAGNLADVATVHGLMVHDGVTPDEWPALADIFIQGSKRDKEAADVLRRAAATHAAGLPLANVVEIYLDVFFTQAMAGRAGLMTKKLAAAYPDWATRLGREQVRLADLHRQLKIAETIERTGALVTIADEIVDAYDRAKAARGLLDFDDLIDKTQTLLERSDTGWILHKLDAGIDHVLVDEAQDTSEAQWRILERLTDDFASGAGARPRDRSFFVVGDEKQSIFSFQGAAPAMFDEMRGSFERRFRAGRMPFERVSLNVSFRSTPGVLAAVETMFEPSPHRDGLVSRDMDWVVHESLKANLPSLVEIWPAFGAAPATEPEDWTIPVDLESETHPASVLADRVARKVKELTSPGCADYVHEGRGVERRPIRAGDILILVRTRNAFFEAVIRALKSHGVDVAGADRLDIANHIAVMDLVVAGRAALLPQDDLSVACVLKSPLFGFSDEDLVAIAPGRRGSLFAALAAAESPAHRAAHATLTRWAARAAGATPFAFYVELLGRDRGRHLIETRLGPEAHDAIDEFLRLALAHEREGAPALASFLADVEALETSVKRDMDAPGDAVRVMTVHAAKGLEAKIVFLPDTCAVPDAKLDPKVFDLDEGTGRPPLIAWSPRKGDDPAEVAEAREKVRTAAMREYRRLLYVAMTRAEERLYIAGFYNLRKPPADCWSKMVELAFPASPDVPSDVEEVPAFWDAAQTIFRLHRAGTAAGGRAPPAPAEQGVFRLGSSWLNEPIAAAPAPALLRRATTTATAPSAERRAALAYGEMLHLLLEHLPRHAPALRADKARAYLAARPGVVPRERHAVLVDEALGVLAIPELAPLFEPTARAEVAVLGAGVSGQVDRLVVLADVVLVADFKSGPPTAEVPADYRRQMALYRDALAPLWPGRRLRMLLVWTQSRQVVEL